MKTEEDDGDEEIRFDKIDITPDAEAINTIKRALAKPAQQVNPYRHLRLQIGEVTRLLSESKTRVAKLKATISKHEKTRRDLIKVYEKVSGLKY